MNKTTRLISACLLLTLLGCSKSFAPLFADAQVAYSAGRWIDTIDNINLALPYWREDDGQEQKAQAYQLLGKAYHKLKKIDKATEAYNKAVELSTNTYDSAYELGTIYITSKQSHLAIAAFKEALKMKKDDPYALVGLGNSYYDEGRFGDARIMYQRVLDSSPGVRDAMDYLRLIDEKVRQKTIPHTNTTKIRKGAVR